MTAVTGLLIVKFECKVNVS